MPGMISSIFGKTQQELEKERAEAYQTMITPLKGTGQQRDIQGLANLFSVIARKAAEKRGGDPAMQAAIEAEEQQAALNAQLSELDRNDPRRFYLLSDAYNKAGDTKTATYYLGLGQKIESEQEQFKKDKAEKDATRAAELEKRKTLSEAYPNNPQAQKMALAGFTVDQIEKIIGAKKQKAFIAAPTKEDIEQVSSILAMNEIDFGEETQPVVISKLAEDIAKMKNDYQKEYEAGNIDRPWPGDTKIYSEIIKDYQQSGIFVNDPSLIGGGWKFNPMGQSQQQNQQGQTAVEETYPEGLPTNNNNNTSNQTEASMGTLGDILGLPNEDEINKFKEDYFTPNWQNYLNE